MTAVVRWSGREALNFELTVKTGDQVLARWLPGDGQAVGTIMAINAKSFRVKIGDERTVTCPKFGTRRHSPNNCILPANFFQTEEKC